MYFTVSQLKIRFMYLPSKLLKLGLGMLILSMDLRVICMQYLALHQPCAADKHASSPGRQHRLHERGVFATFFLTCEDGEPPPD